ncbi:DUF427 domain-containing protein [Leptospira ognonensis]|uniref:DUF427 domain-containing protein n=1 Tax=Leptospira ognonensis TaxID=2484945 RepID=A0A4R9JVK2_9LEPT|nr:DUF427 domain-containing protein [Leptospira ognonensis]TGL56990.1 DUF427 domain-containing protein [Leptospira ognonensis]
MKAIWNEQVIAETNDTVVVEGNHYFPRNTLKDEFIKPSSTKTVCAWKGTAEYFTLNVNGKENPDAVWYYANPSKAAENIKGRVAFWKGVEVTK